MPDIGRLIRHVVLGEDLPTTRDLTPEVPKSYREMVLAILFYERSLNRIAVGRGTDGTWLVALPASVYPAGHGPAIGSLKAWGMGVLALIVELEETEQAIAHARRQAASEEGDAQWL